jgi:hypothetical protein
VTLLNGSGTVAQAAVDFTNVTFYNNPVVIGGSGDPFNAASLTFNDVIFAAGTVGLDIVDSVITPVVNNSALVDFGPDALTTTVNGTATLNNVIGADPAFVNVGALDFDVQSTAYATAGTGGAPLAGGAAYIGGVSNVNDWMILND